MHIAEVEGIEEKVVQELKQFSAFQAGNTPIGLDIKIPTKKDYAIDVKILPDRGCYGYGHQYLAREINAFTDCQFIESTIDYRNIEQGGDKAGEANDADESDSQESGSGRDVVSDITIENPNLVPVFTARLYRNIDNTNVPVWMKQALEVVGQRSISFIVDLTNYIMMDIGQPMHAFDADKVQGDIHIRFARDGEKVTLLDGKEMALDPTILVIADETGPLDIAGIKGGKKAEVTADTKNSILTAGNFNPAYIRKTTQKVGIKNDSTKRYENAVTLERVFIAQEQARNMLQTCQITHGPLAVIGQSIEEIAQKESIRTIEVSSEYISQKIGVTFSVSDIESILNKVSIPSDIVSGDILHIHPPIYRQDLHLKEDIVEEIGRLHGYHMLKGSTITHVGAVEVLPSFYFANVIRAALVDIGFSEMYTHSLIESGDIPLANPLSADRSHMRNNLLGEMERVLIKNIQYLDLLKPTEVQVVPMESTSTDTKPLISFMSEVPQDVRVFEIGHVFAQGKETWSFALGIAMKEAKKSASQIGDTIGTVLARLEKVLGCDISKYIVVKHEKQIPPTGGLVPCVMQIISFDFQALLIDFASQAKPGIYPLSDAGLDFCQMGQFTYAPASEYPYIVRDVAVFIPGPKGKAEEVKNMITSLNDPLIVSARQFDQFEKRTKSEDGTIGPVEKTSYAFRLVFQSKTETLTESIVQAKMDHILHLMRQKEGWEVR
jgi:phenylalanyl-tRNA synthetase beta chain